MKTKKEKWPTKKESLRCKLTLSKASLKKASSLIPADFEMGRSGIFYTEDASILGSNSQLNVLHAASAGVWEMSRFPSKVKVGDKVIILPNKNERNINRMAMALVGKISKIESL